MSSQPYSPVSILAICALALAMALGACGSDSEPVAEVSERSTPTQATETTASPTTSTAAEQAAAKRAARVRARAKRKRARAQREREQAQREREQRAATTPTQAPEAPAEPAETPAPQQPTAPTPKPKPGAPAHSIVETASLSLVTKQGVNFVQEGPVTGTLKGQMRLNAKLAGKGVEGTFTVTLANGTLTGQATAALTLDKSVAHFKGTTLITGGTGAYATVIPAALTFSGSVAADASKSTVKLAGILRY